MTRVGLIAAVALALIGCASPTEIGSAPAAALSSQALQWGAPVNGLTVGLALLRYSDQPEPTLLLRCQVKNVGNTPLTTPDPRQRVQLWNGAPPVVVTVGGQPVYRKLRAGAAAQDAGGPVFVLQPDEALSADVPLVLSNWGLKTPLSNVTLQLRLIGGSVEQTARPGATREWLGEAYSGQVIISSLPH